MKNPVVPGFDGQHTADVVLNKLRSLHKGLSHRPRRCLLRQVRQRCCSPSAGVPESAARYLTPHAETDNDRGSPHPRTGQGDQHEQFQMRRTNGLSIIIASRLLEYAEKTANGLVAHDIEPPPGNHRVTLSIAHTFNLSVAR